MKVIYISGPVVGNATKENLEAVRKQNIETAKEYAKALANKRVGFFCPHLHHVDLEGNDPTENQRFYYEQDVEFLIRSNAVLAIPGWETSFGAKQEIKIAEELGLPIFYPKSPNDLNEIEKWNYMKNLKKIKVEK